MNVLQNIGLFFALFVVPLVLGFSLVYGLHKGIKSLIPKHPPAADRESGTTQQDKPGSH